jgi:hypothetical protein
MTLANMHIVELKRIYSQIIAFHPSSGGDATNAAALAALLAKL